MKNKLSRKLAKYSKVQKKQEETDLRKLRKRNFKERLLVWDDEIIKPLDLNRDDTDFPYVIKKKNEAKVKEKMSYCDYNGEYIDSKSITSKFSDHNSKDISKSLWSNFEKQHKFKSGSQFKGSHRNLLLDSDENRSSFGMSCYDEGIQQEDISPIKNLMSPDKILINDIYMEEVNKTPFQDRIRDVWFENYQEVNLKTNSIPKSKYTPLSKDFCKNIAIRTPKKNFDHYPDNHTSFINSSFISPKKEISFGKKAFTSTPLSKTPIQKQTFGTPSHPIDLFEDENTKAEFSNLFSNKSNHFANL